MAKNSKTTENTDQEATPATTSGAVLQDLDTSAVETAATEEISTDDATTAEDVAALAAQGKPMPTGWAYDNKRGFHKASVEVPFTAPMKVEA